MGTWAEKQKMLTEMPPAEIVQRVVTKPPLVEEVEHAQHALSDIRRAAAIRLTAENGGDTVVDRDALVSAIDADPLVMVAAAALERAVEAAEAVTVEVMFRALGQPAYEALVNAHPPSDEDRAKGETMNRGTFLPALLSACHVYRERVGGTDDEPVYEEYDGMTVEDANTLLRTLSQGDAQSLVSAALAVNQVSRLDFVSLGKGSGPTRR